MIYKIEFRPGVSRQIKKVAKEVKDWVFEITGRLAFNPTPKNSKSMTNSPYRRIKPDRHIDSLNTKQYKSVQNFRLIYLLNEETIEVVVISVAQRKDVYKRLAQIL
jgi:mRNA-degrading endonuclease RelE of RelBE toxin-antitoxin system